MESIEGRYIKKCAEFFSLGLDPYVPLDNIACLQIKSADLGWGHINVIISRQIILTADKSVSIRKDFQDPVSFLATVQLSSFPFSL